MSIRAGSVVQRVLFDKQRAIGVEALVDGAPQRWLARRVTLSAGAIHSPLILMRSGIGARDELRRLGVDVVADLPVGERLIDHPGVGIHALPRAGMQGERDPNHQTMVRYTARGSDEFNDMQLFLFGRITLMSARLRQNIGAERTFLASASLVRPHSVGRLIVTGVAPDAAPTLQLNFGAAEADRKRLAEGLRLCWEALHCAPLADRIDQIPGWSDDVFRSDAALERAVSAVISTSYHPVSTAPMGPDGDAGAVVDQACCVKGVEGLRVVDASIMPTIPRANTNLPCIMIAERVADLMRAAG